MQYCLELCHCPPLSLPVPVQGHVDGQAGGLQEVGDEVPADDAGLAGPHLPLGGGEVPHPAWRTQGGGGHLGWITHGGGGHLGGGKELGSPHKRFATL